MNGLIASSRKTHGDDLPLINLKDPTKSLLLLKPMAKVPKKDADGNLLPPSSSFPVSHMGGLKIHKDDHTYKAFVSWIEDYARVVEDGYESEEQLPRHDWIPTQFPVRVKQVPKNWIVGETIQLFFYPWDEEARSWSEVPTAFAQSVVTPRRIFNGVLFQLPQNGQAKRLANGRYRVRAYRDPDKRLDADPTLLLNDGKPAGQSVIDARWKIGFKNAQIIQGRSFE